MSRLLKDVPKSIKLSESNVQVFEAEKTDMLAKEYVTSIGRDWLREYQVPFVMGTETKYVLYKTM